MLEHDMMEIGYEYLSKLPNIKIIKKEVPFLSRCIDIVMLNDLDEIISIEFKVSKWRHAIEQAINHKLGADKAYICLPMRNITTTLSNAIEEAGIGLLLYDETSEIKISEAIPLKKEKSNVTAFRNILCENMMKI